MQLKEQLRKHSSWTVTAMTAGAVSVVAATGMALADNVGNRARLLDQILLQDSAPVAKAAESIATPGIIHGTILFAGHSSSFESPLDDGPPVAADAPSQAVASVASAEASLESASLDSPQASLPPVTSTRLKPPAQDDSYDNPAYVAPQPIQDSIESVDSHDSPASVQSHSVASLDSDLSFDSPS